MKPLYTPMRLAVPAILAVSTLFLSSCRGEVGEGFLSSATVDADLWKVSPSAPGTIASVTVREGDTVVRGQILATIDTVPLVLKLSELDAAMAELSAGVAAREAEHRVLAASHRGVEREASRARALVADGAAPSRSQDESETLRETSAARLAASKSAIAAMRAKSGVLKAQRVTLRDQIARCRLAAPAAGTVLTRFRGEGEAAVPGRPVVEIGRTDTMWAEFFVPQTILSSVRLGQLLRLRLDDGGEGSWIPARLAWISSTAEFTPKGVQTRESRNELVFRCRALAANPEGALKRGLPVEVWR